jgi:hypothetical protein
MKEWAAMDFITHSLVGAGVARLTCPRREWLPQLTLAGLLGSLLMDGDSWLVLISQDAYGLYHRVLTHNVFALGVLALAGGVAARSAGGLVAASRRFGWFVSPNLPAGELPTRAPWRYFFVIIAIASLLHWLMDLITGFGNLKPFWPLSQYSVELDAVNSLDAFILGFTVLWHVALRLLDWPRRKEAWVTGAYALVLVAYVAARLAWGPRTAW